MCSTRLGRHAPRVSRIRPDSATSASAPWNRQGCLVPTNARTRTPARCCSPPLCALSRNRLHPSAFLPHLSQLGNAAADAQLPARLPRRQPHYRRELAGRRVPRAACGEGVRFGADAEPAILADLGFRRAGLRWDLRCLEALGHEAVVGREGGGDGDTRRVAHISPHRSRLACHVKCARPHSASRAAPTERTAPATAVFAHVREAPLMS